MMAAADAPAAGYSGTPLAQKLGFKDGQRVLFVDLPPSLAPLRVARHFSHSADAAWQDLPALAPGIDIVHGFTASRAVLAAAAPELMRLIRPDGAAWISWPKKASRMPTDITEDTIRELVLPLGLVDVKVCAVDAIWSGLKLVIRKELRGR